MEAVRTADPELLTEACYAGPAADTTSDEMLAQMLQLQFDQEYDRDLGRVEAKFNGSSKGIMLKPFFYLHLH